MGPGTRLRERRAVKAGGLTIGGKAPVSVQGMTKCDSHDERALREQVSRLAGAGCEIVRIAVPDREALEPFGAVARESPIPVVADIHFDFRLALGALEAGAHKIRINPGNIGEAGRVRAVAAAALERGVPIRVGVNSGSLEKDLLEEYGGPTARALVESARRHVVMLEDAGFRDIVISLKSSRVPVMVEAYRIAAGEFQYPLHVGVTETGAGMPGIVKSAAGIGVLLLDGIGDTIRVSLTGDPVQEVLVGQQILVAAGLRKGRPEIISCPTCGRCAADVAAVADELRRRLEADKPDLTVAVMGCEVNGPGEAREADVGIAIGKGRAAIFIDGEVFKSVPLDRVVDELVSAVRERAARRAVSEGCGFGRSGAAGGPGA